jgi:beta-glucosidase
VPYNPQYKEYCTLLKEAVNEKKISEERLNDAVRRILRAKYALGLFENQLYPAATYPDFGSSAFKLAAQHAAEESITLLKNEQQLLPLKKGKTILVAGPTANNLIYLNGAWTHTWQGMDSAYNTKGCKTVFAAIQEKNGKENTLYSEGVRLELKNGWETCSPINTDDFDNKAAKSDLIVLCLGELPATEKPGDIRSLDLPKEQLELAKRAFAAHKPVVLVLLEGRPRIIHEIVGESTAILQAYLPGDYGGTALAEIVFGEVNPSGKLPYSYPKYNGVIEHYDLKNSEKRSGKTNQFDAYDPEWDFGVGMSYSTFEYSNLRLSKNTLAGADSIMVSCDVKNTSKIDGKEVVQLYLSNLVASISPWGKRLKGFSKISLKAGETKTVTFPVSQKEVIFVNAKNEWVVEAGVVEVAVGPLKARLNVNY